ncbi:MAG: type VI secretion system tip protein VgrG [Chitinophagaceae bacterium]|nr:type VI secretion system tip protein VgrG [Chitinophagaceae bacterium]
MAAESILSSLSLVKDDSLASSRILVEGNEVPARYRVLAITVQYEINKIPTATLRLADCTDKMEDFAIGSVPDLLPGKKIEIQLGYQNDTETVFKGMIIKNSPSTSGQCPEMTLECKDEMVKMTITRKNRNFRDITDHDIITQLSDDNNIGEKEITGFSIKHEQLVQQNISDWDYLVSRADVNGGICLNRNGKLIIRQPDLTAEPVLSLAHGVNLLEYHADMDARVSSQAVKTYTWDFDRQDVREVESDDMDIPGNSQEGNTSSLIEQLQQVSQAPYEMVTSYLTAEEQKAITNAKKQRQVLSVIKGKVKYQGITKAMPGDFIQLNGVGDNFTGKAFVAAIQHEYTDGDWLTEATIGWNENFFAEAIHPSHPASATGQISSVQGLQPAIVTDITDSSGQYRVKVRLPLVNKDDEGIYARVATLDAGDKRGTFFRPELNDEVLVGFMNDDPRHPVILGMLHSSSKQAPLEPENENHLKGYVSRSGIKILFDDEKKCLLIETPGNRVAELNDDAGAITLSDDHGNKIVMNADGISIESAKDLVLKAAKSVSISSPEITIKADASLSLEGSGSVKLKSGGIAEIKGSLVKIN